MLRYILILAKICLITTSLPVFAYKMTIYTDQQNQVKAKEVEKLFLTTYPFNQYDINFEIVATTAAKLECARDQKIERLVVCNSSYVEADSVARGSDQAFIVSDLPQTGGSGGSIPVITTRSNPRMILHEYLHTLGLSDEYAYSSSEAELYCSPSIPTANLTLIPPLPSYADDSEARTKHSADIPWYNRIEATTLITHGIHLGTNDVDASTEASPNDSAAPLALSKAIGLYRGKTCDQMPAPFAVSWHPNGEPTIMEYLHAGLGAPLETIVAGILDSKGVSKRASAPPLATPLPASVKDEARDATTDAKVDVINKQESSPSVNH